MASGKTKTSTLLKENRLAPKKRFGQNFLVHAATAERIVRECNIDPDDTILEVGVGLGALTTPLANHCRKVIGFEIDSGLVRYHEQQKDLPENVTLIHQDILKADFDVLDKAHGPGLRLVTNLPYSISNPFIFKLIENARHVRDAHVMLQKEMADRLTAQVGTKAYGVPTVLLARCATVRKLFTLKPDQFHPRPKIDSVVVSITFQSSDDTQEVDSRLFTRLVRTTFNQRRKTIGNTIAKGGFFFTTEKQRARSLAHQAIERAGLSADTRPEQLSCSDFLELTACITRLADSNT